MDPGLGFSPGPTPQKVWGQPRCGFGEIIECLKGQAGRPDGDGLRVGRLQRAEVSSVVAAEGGKLLFPSSPPHGIKKKSLKCLK